MKKRILMVNEFSYLATGYSTYGREVLTRLHDSGKYEVAELACYVASKDRRLQYIPWRVYPNLPVTDEEKQIYDQDPLNNFGAFRFEDVCLDFKPDIVFDIRDFWMFSHQVNSPYRPYFKHVIMPTVDAYPQKDEWLNTYQNADAVLTYQEWSGKVLVEQSGGKVDWRGSACPAFSSEYSPKPDRKAIKSQLGLPANSKIVGTVMRNQRRKLYPDLFAAFRKYLDQSGDDNTYLYCHTSYPEGWDIPTLLQKNSLSSKVFFTHVCKNCSNIYPSTFQGGAIVCPKCRQLAMGLASVNMGISPSNLATIMNTFDIYVQYANSEGMGMPQVEAAACGVPVASVDYSAMSDVVRRVKGYPIPVLALPTEMETGCQRAIPDEAGFINILTNFFNMPSPMRDRKRKETREATEEYYSWDKTTAKWMEVFDSIEPLTPEQGWLSQPRIYQPATPTEDIANNSNNIDYARWLISKVLCEPEKLNTFLETRLVRDLNQQARFEGIQSMYYNEQSSLFENTKREYKPFNREMAYNQLANMCHRRNQWEEKRAMAVQS